jgi:hypothetical protein
MNHPSYDQEGVEATLQLHSADAQLQQLRGTGYLEVLPGKCRTASR